MSSKRLIFFVGLVVITLGYAVFDVFSEKQQEAARLEKALILNWKPDQIDQIEWVTGPQKMKLERTAEGWFFTEPIQEKADSEQVISFTEGLVLERASATVQELETTDWGLFGLVEPKARIRIRNNSGQTVEFSISAKKNFQGETYFRLGQDKKVLLVSSSWQQKAEKRVLDFRDRRWARISPADVEVIQVHRGQERFRLVKKENTWVLQSQRIGQSDWHLDQNKVRKVLTSFSSHQVLGFELQAQAQPMVEVVLESKSGRIWSGSFGVNSEKKHFLKVANLGLRMEVSAQDVDEVYKLSADSLRDRTEPFQLRAVDVRKVNLKSNGLLRVFELQQDKWKLISGAPTDHFNEEVLRLLLPKISQLEVSDFAVERPKNWKELPEQSLELVAGDGKVLLSLQLRGPFAMKKNGLEKSAFFVKSNLSSAEFTMDESKWRGLAWESVFTEPKKEESQQ